MARRKAPAVPARRGDLLIVEVQARAGLRYAPRGIIQHDFLIGVVTSITRDGEVRRWRPAGRREDWRLALEKPFEVWRVPAADVHVDRALAAATEVSYGRASGVRYPSIGEVMLALRPHSVTPLDSLTLQRVEMAR